MGAAEAGRGGGGPAPPPAGLLIVVLAYGDPTRAGQLAARLTAEGCPPSTIVVVANPAGSVRDAVRDDGGPVEVEVLDHNRGYAGGMNAAIDLARRRGAREVALVTHDVDLRLEALQTLHRVLVEDSTVALAGPVLVSADTGEVFSAGGRLGDGEVDHRRTRPDAGDIRVVDWLDGSVLVARLVALVEVGGFDERYFMYGEDVDLCLRLRAAGWRCVVVGAAEAAQASGVADRLGAYRYLRTRNLIETFAKQRDARRVARVVRGAVRTAWPHLLHAPEARALRDVALRRFGPPPRSLLTGTDIAATVPSRRRRGT